MKQALIALITFLIPQMSVADDPIGIEALRIIEDGKILVREPYGEWGEYWKQSYIVMNNGTPYVCIIFGDFDNFTARCNELKPKG